MGARMARGAQADRTCSSSVPKFRTICRRSVDLPASLAPSSSRFTLRSTEDEAPFGWRCFEYSAVSASISRFPTRATSDRRVTSSAERTFPACDNWRRRTGASARSLASAGLAGLLCGEWRTSVGEKSSAATGGGVGAPGAHLAAAHPRLRLAIPTAASELTRAFTCFPVTRVRCFVSLTKRKEK